MSDDIRKQFYISVGGGKYSVDPYSRELVMKTDSQGRQYHDFGDYQYSEKDLQKLMDFLNTENETARNVFEGAVDRGYNPMQAMAVSKMGNFLPLVNLPYAYSDAKNNFRKGYQARAEGRNLAATGYNALGLLDAILSAAPPLYAAKKGIKAGVNKLKGILE